MKSCKPKRLVEMKFWHRYAKKIVSCERIGVRPETDCLYVGTRVMKVVIIVSI